MKTQVQIDCEERAKTHPCPKCRGGNVKDKIHLSTCQHCGALIDCSYLFAPWGLTWEDLQKLRDNLEQLFSDQKEIKE